MTPRLTVLTVTALLAGLAACAAPNQPPASSPTGPPTKTFPAGDEIPEHIRVRAPKDARGIAPCQLLTRAQIIELGMLPDTATEDGAGQQVGGCGWGLADDPRNGGGIVIRVDSTHPALLGLYRLHAAAPLLEFMPIEIAGHPAVASARTSTAGCTVDVGIADDQVLSAGGNVRGRKIPDPCGLSRRIAEAVLSNLPPMR